MWLDSVSFLHHFIPSGGPMCTCAIKSQSPLPTLLPIKQVSPHFLFSFSCSVVLYHYDLFVLHPLSIWYDQNSVWLTWQPLLYTKHHKGAQHLRPSLAGVWFLSLQSFYVWVVHQCSITEQAGIHDGTVSDWMKHNRRIALCCNSDLNQKWIWPLYSKEQNGLWAVPSCLCINQLSSAAECSDAEPVKYFSRNKKTTLLQNWTHVKTLAVVQLL